MIPDNTYSEITEYYAAKMPKENGAFIQSETEVSGMNMVAGSSTGKRAMMATSGPGISLVQSHVIYGIVELLAVIVNVMTRPRDGTGSCTGDYFQAVKGQGMAIIIHAISLLIPVRKRLT